MYGRSYIGSIPVRESDFSLSRACDMLITSFLKKYRKSSIKSSGGLFISNPFEGGLNRDGRLI